MYHLKQAIGVFDSGYGGLTILKEFIQYLPQYNYIYIGDNAHAPYGTKSMETVYSNTLHGIKKLMQMQCPLIILACNTASAKALRTIQQQYLPTLKGAPKVLGIIRPTTEIIDSFTYTKNIGIFATQGTVDSLSYVIEINKFFPHIQVFQEACPIWVEIVENNEIESEGTDYFIKKHVDNLLKKNHCIDTILLGCTHYPFLEKKIRKYLPPSIQLIAQGKIVANSLKQYLEKHIELAAQLSTTATCQYFTTENPANFDIIASRFLGHPIVSQKITL